MPTSYTPLLGLALPATGELAGTWGTTALDGVSLTEISWPRRARKYPNTH